jgi:dolichol-phosphate mannosyltransferase
LDKIVIIPTFNEKENIEAIIAAVMNLPNNFHVLIVDDGSPDGTAAIVKSLFAQYANRLFLEERKGKLGLGTAYIHGFKWSLKNNYQFIFEMDADFSHNPKDLLRLYEACANGADVAVGSRYVKGGAVENWPANRIALSKGAIEQMF